MPSFLDREKTVAPPGFNRWLVPPAAIAVQMCIGEIYGFSVFNLPLSRAVGITKSLPGQDWAVPDIVLWTYSLGLVILGLSAAFLGKWVESHGPRKTMFAAACCFCGGLVIASFGVSSHQLWLLGLGYGLVGGVGLGLGYIAPVSTLVKWFPDRPGMATGMAIMGFGSGALVGGPLGVVLMDHFKTATSVGVQETFFVMAGLYFVMMNFGALIVRVPAPGWKPDGYVAPATPQKLVTTANVTVDVAWKTPQFWLLWMVLCTNVTAGIGVLAQASPMAQDMFGVNAAVAGGFVGLLSIFNTGGRFLWSSFSDVTGRKGIYCVYFLLGCVLYLTIPYTQKINSVTFFVAVACVIISMYGGGFATIPAYLRDMFGTMQVGAIHGRVITAWSMAAVLGPQLVTNISAYQKAHGVPKGEAYNTTLYVMAGVLLIGLICNLLVRPVASVHHAKTTT
ncbi:MAG TPA: OFA family MFS transporter [Candidatus Didemnitutus sp.]|nr:OFA family MFS transporter [Candidatus Didemnitutus sp.]